jgi:Domain of Unknown Function (DUF1080)
LSLRSSLVGSAFFKIKNNILKPVYYFFGILVCLSACQNANKKNQGDSNPGSTKSSTASDSGWVAFFDGNLLKGWHTYGKAAPGAAWNVDSGSIHLQSAAKSGYQTAGGGDLITDGFFDNFDLKLEWKISKKGNSGIIFYVQEETSKYKET